VAEQGKEKRGRGLAMLKVAEEEVSVSSSEQGKCESGESFNQQKFIKLIL
jgi:hypothetical protein